MTNSGRHHERNWPFLQDAPAINLGSGSDPTHGYTTLAKNPATGLPYVALRQRPLVLANGSIDYMFKYFQAISEIPAKTTIITEDPLFYWRSNQASNLPQRMKEEYERQNRDNRALDNLLQELTPQLHQGSGHDGSTQQQQIKSNTTTELPLQYGNRTHQWQGVYHYRSFLNHACEAPNVVCHYTPKHIWSFECEIRAVERINMGDILVLQYAQKPPHCVCPTKCGPAANAASGQGNI